MAVFSPALSVSLAGTTTARTSFVLSGLATFAARPFPILAAWRPQLPPFSGPPSIASLRNVRPFSSPSSISKSSSSLSNRFRSTPPPDRPPPSSQPPDLYAESPELDDLLLQPSDAPALAHIVTYNVLSSSLASPSYLRACDPGDLDAHTRLQRLLAKLEEPIASRAVICLQEVSLAWAGPLHAFFASRNFHFVLASYGSYFSGFMGVALAFPLASYDVLDVKIERLSDTHAWPPRAHVHTGAVKLLVDLRERVAAVWRALFADVADLRSGARPKRGRPGQIWNEARDRRNMFIFARLRAKANGARLCVGTYHMPCAFYSPPLMQIHAALVVGRFQEICASDAGVLAGDFNFKPGDESYRMITTGQIDAGHRDYPKRSSVPDGSDPGKWMPRVRYPMKSAYKAVLGSEPDFTNYNQPGGAAAFIDTLDYIFCSEDLDVVDVVRLPHRKAVIGKGPYPTAKEPSDHCLIGCTMRLPAAETRARRRVRDRDGDRLREREADRLRDREDDRVRDREEESVLQPSP